MFTIVTLWMEMPFSIRVLMTIALAIGLWSVLGKRILFVLSVVPLLLRKIWSMLYLIIEFPIAILHEKFGYVFCQVDNFVADVGGQIDKGLEKCHIYFKSDYKFKTSRAVIVGGIIWLYIIIPYGLTNQPNVVQFGTDLYCSLENRMVNAIISSYPEDTDVINIFGWNDTSLDMKLTVSGVSSTLYVRDIPDKDEGSVLANLYNGDEVQWTGKMRFAEWDYGYRAILVEVITIDGIQGWSLFDYLAMDEYETMEFKVEVE